MSEVLRRLVVGRLTFTPDRSGNYTLRGSRRCFSSVLSEAGQCVLAGVPRDSPACSSENMHRCREAR